MKRRMFALIFSLILLLTACGEKAPAWQEQYDLGIRYLSEGNYEEAILAFTAAIQIDPKQEQLYLSLAEAYAASGNIEKAAETLQIAIAELGETEILTMAQALFIPAEPAPTPQQPSQGVVRTERKDNPDQTYTVTEFGPGDVKLREVTYDADGRMLHATFYNHNGSVNYVSEYDANGNLIRTTHYNPDGSVNYYAEGECDANGNLIRTVFYNPDGSVNFYTENERDADGNLIRTVFYNPDGSVSHVN